jgi:hypothetical protein
MGTMGTHHANFNEAKIGQDEQNPGNKKPNAQTIDTNPPDQEGRKNCCNKLYQIHPREMTMN